MIRTDKKSLPVNLLGIDVFDHGGNQILIGITPTIKPGIFESDDAQFGPRFLNDGIHTESDSDGNMRVATSVADPAAYLQLAFAQDTVISKIVIYNRKVGQTKTRINGCNLVVVNAAGSVVFDMPLSDTTDVITYRAPFPAPTPKVICKSIVLYNGTGDATGGIGFRVWDNYGMEIKIDPDAYVYDPWVFTKLVLKEEIAISRIDVQNRPGEDATGRERINGSVVVARNAAGVGVFISDPLSGAQHEYSFAKPFPVMNVTRSELVNKFDQPEGECRHKINRGVCDNTISNGEYSFNLQDDGNVVLYKGSVVKWASNTYKNKDNRHGPYQWKLQWDGNLVATDRYRNIVWASGGQPTGFHTAVMQGSDGNFVIYDDSDPPRAKWHTKGKDAGHWKNGYPN